MSALDAVTDDTDAPQSALVSLQAPPVSPEGRAWGESYLKQHPEGVDTKGEAALLQDFDANAQEARNALKQARERLAAQRMDPSVLGLRFAQAMLSPSAHGIPDQWGKAAGAVADWRQQNQAFQQQQGDEDTGLAEKLSGVDRDSLKARLALQELQERTQGSMLNTAIRATAKPPGTQGQDKLTEMDTPGGGKQYAWVSPGAHSITPTGPKLDPKGGALTPETIQAAYDTFKRTGSFGVFEPKGMGAAAARMQLINATSAMAVQNNDSVIDAALNGQAFKARQQTEKDFSPGGRIGQQITATNRSVAHLGQLRDLYAALDNGDVQAINAARNKVREWFGDADPTNIQAVGPFVAAETEKSVVPGAGTGGERDRIAALFNTAKSPSQVNLAGGAIDQYLSLLKSQLDIHKFNYETTLGRRDFEASKLTPDTRKALGIVEPVNAPPSAVQLPDAAKARLQEGFTTTFANGQKWTLHNGQPVQVP